MTIGIENIEVMEKRSRFLVVEGEEAPIVFVHGEGIDTVEEYWGGLPQEVHKLVDNRKIIAIELPGFGESEAPDEFSTTYYIRFLGNFLDKMGLMEVDLLGCSLGGAVALATSIMAPNRVNKLVLVNSFGLWKKLPYHLFHYFLIHTPFLNKYVPKIHFSSLNWNNSTLKWLKNEVSWNSLETILFDKLCHLQAETLLCHSNGSYFSPVSWSARAANEISDSMLHVIEDCGHLPFKDCFEKFSAIVYYFLENNKKRKK